MTSFKVKNNTMKTFSWPLFVSILLMGSLIIVSSCKKDDPEPPDDVVASFQYAISSTNYLEVSFTNFSTPADATYAWDFGDVTTSTEKDPTHLYTEEGTYTVKLTTTNSVSEASFSESITITDPDKALKLLTGEVSKTWKLYREGTALMLGPNAANPAGWWVGMSNDQGIRPCLFMQTFTYHFDGSFVFDDMDVFWGENDPFAGTAQHETCFVPDATTMINKDGADVSAWGSGTHAFTYDASTGEVVLNGMGAWMGFVHVVGATENYSNVPTATRKFNISITEETGFDLMTLTYDLGDADAGGDGLWTAIYVNYSDSSLEPDLVTEPPGCSPLTVISPAELSRTFASAAADQYVLLDTIASGSGIVYGADDPANAAGTKVGKFIRNAGVDYQELKLQVSPEAKDINFENITTISLEVYLPSGNDYTGLLTDNVILGLGETTCPPDWWTDNIEYTTEAIAKDIWVTLTYDITTPTFVNKPENGASPKDRNDLDMIYINIGGGGHQVGAEFYIRNLIFN
ncbi:MAG: PKD domain-containing protein [Bacteroidales bacterium]|nr:PKD domain-containing protein [Bacteroidales bacterium]